MLKQCVPTNGNVTISYSQIFRDSRHDNKFPTAIADFEKQAPECIILAKGMFDPAIFNSKIFDSTPPIIADFNARMAIFYCDIDSKDKIIQVPAVEKSVLANAIDKLKTITMNLDIP